MGPLDSAAKALLHGQPADVAELAPLLAGRQIVGAEPDDTVLPAHSLTMDKVLRLTVDEGGRLSLHVEVEASWSADVPRKTFQRWSLAHRVHDRLWSLVICLKPGRKQGAPKRTYERRVGRRRVVHFAFDVVEAWELSADDLLRDAKPGLLTLVPYAAGTTRRHVERAMEALATIEPERRRGELQAALVAFADNVYPDVDWAARMPEELLMRSSIYERGEVSGQRKTLARQLTKRLGEAGEALAERTWRAEEAVLEQATDLFAERLSDDALAERLDELLPRGTPAAADDEAE